MKPHPAADLFPLMDGAAFEALVDDIRTNGLAHPIVTHGGMVLDGRNRLNACYRANVTPRFEKYAGKSPLAYAVSANLARRHLDVTDRAKLGARLKPLFEAEAKERAMSGTLAPPDARGKASAKAAEVVGVSPKSVERVEKVGKKGAAATIKAMDAKEISVTTAAEIADLPKREQPAAIKEALEPEAHGYSEADQRAELAADYAAMVKIYEADAPLNAAREEIASMRKRLATTEAILAGKDRSLQDMTQTAARWMKKAKKSAACQNCMTALERP